MIRLFNISRSGKDGCIVSANYTCESDPAVGTLVVNAKTEEIISVEDSEIEKAGKVMHKTYRFKAVGAMIDIYELNITKDKYTYSWY